MDCLGLLSAWHPGKSAPSRWHRELRAECRSRRHFSSAKALGSAQRIREQNRRLCMSPGEGKGLDAQGLEQPESGFWCVLENPRKALSSRCHHRVRWDFPQ